MKKLMFVTQFQGKYVKYNINEVNSHTLIRLINEYLCGLHSLSIYLVDQITKQTMQLQEQSVPFYINVLNECIANASDELNYIRNMDSEYLNKLDPLLTQLENVPLSSRLDIIMKIARIVRQDLGMDISIVQMDRAPDKITHPN